MNTTSANILSQIDVCPGILSGVQPDPITRQARVKLLEVKKAFFCGGVYCVTGQRTGFKTQDHFVLASVSGLTSHLVRAAAAAQPLDGPASLAAVADGIARPCRLSVKKVFRADVDGSQVLIAVGEGRYSQVCDGSSWVQVVPPVQFRRWNATGRDPISP